MNGIVNKKKSDHKHEYEWNELQIKKWFTHEKKCTICGHVNDKERREECGK